MLQQLGSWIRDLQAQVRRENIGDVIKSLGYVTGVTHGLIAAVESWEGQKLTAEKIKGLASLRDEIDARMYTITEDLGYPVEDLKKAYSKLKRLKAVKRRRR